jgi:hypothetical protein
LAVTSTLSFLESVIVSSAKIGFGTRRVKRGKEFFDLFLSPFSKFLLYSLNYTILAKLLEQGMALGRAQHIRHSLPHPASPTFCGAWSTRFPQALPHYPGSWVGFPEGLVGICIFVCIADLIYWLGFFFFFTRKPSRIFL